MKTFLNVLYRRILYKIPLKLLLILLAVFGVLFACFSNADLVIEREYYNKEAGGFDILPDNGDEILCVKFLEDCGSMQGNFGINYNMPGGQNYSLDNVGTGDFALFYCILSNSVNYMSVWTDISCPLEITHIKSNEYTSLECQTEYNLIPISSVDQNYCTINNLCPFVVPSGTGNLTQLYINNILHVGAPTILMNIPDEIDWDYAYTQGGNIMNIDIVGYNVDYQAVEDEINIQKYKPSGEELSLIVSNIIPLFVPGLCIILLLYFIFKFIKKVF